MKKAVLQHLIKKCRKDLLSGRHPQKDNFIHWTFLVRNGRIVSQGVNRPIEPSRYYGYHSVLRCDSDSFTPKWHSELDALHRSGFCLRDYIAVNVRLNKTGELRLSLPCTGCRRILKVMNCEKVYFTSESGWGQLTL